MDNSTNTSSTDPMLTSIISKNNSDMKFVGMYNIIVGALACLSIIGAIVGIPIIIAGIRLRESADSFEEYMSSSNSASLQRGFERQQRFFFIQKVFIIIGIVFFCLYILFFIGILMSGSRY